MTAARNACDAQNFAAVGGKTDIVERKLALVVLNRKLFDNNSRLGIFWCIARDIKADLFAHPHFGKRLLGSVLCFNRVNILAFPQNGYPVGNFKHLVEFVGDDDD